MYRIGLFFLLFFSSCSSVIKDLSGIKDLGDGFIYNEECHHITSSNFDIPPVVKSYYCEKEYIIVCQDPTFYYDGMYNYPQGFTKEKYVNGIDCIYYWIINKREKKVYGPYLSGEFNLLIKKLNIEIDIK